MHIKSKEEEDIEIATALAKAASHSQLSSKALRALIRSLTRQEFDTRQREERQAELERKQEQRIAAAAAKQPENFWAKARQNWAEYEAVQRETAGLKNEFWRQKQVIDHFYLKGVDPLSPPPTDTLGELGLSPKEIPDPSDASDEENEPPTKKSRWTSTVLEDSVGRGVSSGAPNQAAF